MGRTHTHQEGGPTCRYTTKRECNLFFRQYMEDKKAEYDRCQALKAETKRADRVILFDTFIANEWARMEADARS